MSENLTRRYTIKAGTNLALGLGSGAFGVWLGHSFYQSAKMSIATHFGSKSRDEIQKIAESAGHEYKSHACLKKAELPTNTATGTITYHDGTYIQCMKDDGSIRAIVMGGFIAAFLCIYAAKSLRKSASFASLARKVSNNQGQDISFRLLSDEDAALESEADYNSAAHEFEINNGIGANATIQLQPGQVVQTERGAMLAKGSAIEMETVSSGSGTKSKSRFMRIASGEGLLKVIFTNNSDQPEPLMLAPEDGKQLTAINLDQDVSVFCNNGAFFASSALVDVDLKLIKNLTFQTFSGQGFSFQQITGLEDGTSVLLTSPGQVTAHKLAEGQGLDIQKGSLFALTGNVTLQLKETSGGFNRIASGENGFMTSVTGPGTVWLLAHSAGAKKRERSFFRDMLKPGD